MLNSYTQVFFSDHKFFALILMAVTFFDVPAGIAGALAVTVSNGAAFLMGLNRQKIRKGYYGFNSLLVGLGLGIWYQPGVGFYLVLTFAALLTLFLTLWLEGVIGKYGLPYLSLPFLFGTWMVSLATRQFTALHVSENGIYMMNEMFQLGGRPMVDSYVWFSGLKLPEWLHLYFTSLGAIFFQHHLFAGILIALGLLIYSRIAFVLSLTGLFAAYAYYGIIGADLSELSYSYIGFNFILTAIAAGGFFIIPSRWSFLWVVLLTPLISILLTGTQSIFAIFQLSVYSLPFNLVVLLFLYALKFRERSFDKPDLVSYQEFSPEKNLYSHLNHRHRFGRASLVPVQLPFWGEWKVTQGHNGPHTHQGEWRHAWDFEVTDRDGNTFSGDGTHREDYLAYGKPVVAPADGVVEELVDGTEENEIGQVDLGNNWGNTLVIRHGEGLYSKLSHLKPGSFRVAAGDHVRKGQVLAACGNSGRSPVPHLHFQLQATPWIGSRTLDYPVSHYLRQRAGSLELCSYESPETGDDVANISRNSSLEKAFHFIPGQVFTYTATTPDGRQFPVKWEVKLNPLNQVCLECEETGAKAWLRNDDDIHLFTFFEGDRSSLLYRFFLCAYRVPLGYYRNLLVKDRFAANTFNNSIIGLLQDFVAPFFLFTRSDYMLLYAAMEDGVMQSGIRLEAGVTARIGRYGFRSLEGEFLVGPDGLERFAVKENGKETILIRPETP